MEIVSHQFSAFSLITSEVQVYSYWSIWFPQPLIACSNSAPTYFFLVLSTFGFLIINWNYLEDTQIFPSASLIF